MSKLAVVDTRLVPVDELIPYGRNPRQGDVGVITQSVRAHGQYRAIVVNQRDMRIVAGNHTYLGLREDGATEALVHFIDVDDAEAEQIMLVDNRANDLASNDEPMLVEILRDIVQLQGVEGLLGTGYDGDDLDDLLKRFDGDQDASPALGAVEYRLIIECDSEQHQGELLARFESEGLRVQAIAQ